LKYIFFVTSHTFKHILTLQILDWNKSS